MSNTLYRNFINFFVKYNLYDEEMFNYIRSNSEIFNYLDKDMRMFIGSFALIVDSKLDEIKLFVPMIKDEETLLINVNEYVKAILMYKYLGKDNFDKYYNRTTSIAIGLLYQKLYLYDNPSKEGMVYMRKLEESFLNGNDDDYKNALNIHNELLDCHLSYKNHSKVVRSSKRLVKKYEAR